jgi:RsiW-degrading membrane proteinase PrsW (M82 family)
LAGLALWRAQTALEALRAQDHLGAAELRDSGYAAHFNIPRYELNPVWQKTIARKRWLNGKHLALTVIVGTACVLLSEIPHQRISDVFFGFALAVLGLVNGRHLSNLAVFAYVRRRPHTLSGTVTMSHELVLWLSLFQLAPVMLTLMLLWIINAARPQIAARTRIAPL